MQLNDTIDTPDTTAAGAAGEALPAKPARAPRTRKAKDTGAGSPAAAAGAPAAGASTPDTFTGDLLAGATAPGDAAPAASAPGGMPGPGSELVAALGQDIAALAMPTIKLEQYVATLFKPYRDKFSQLRAEADLIAFTEEGKAHAESLQAELPEEQRQPVQLVDITTKEGFALAIRYRAAFRDDVRLAAEKRHKERKAPVLQIGRLLDSTWNTIRDDAKPHEERFDAVIKAEESRKEREKLEAEERERTRVAAIKAKITAITDLPRALAGATSDQLAKALADLANITVTKEEYAEFDGEAALALDTVGGALFTLYEGTKAREDQAAEATRQQELARAQLAEQSASLERQRAELEEQRRVQDAAQLAAQVREQQAKIATAEITALNAMAMKEGEAIELQHVLDQVQAKEITAAQFGDMEQLASMARHMAVVSLRGKIDAQVAAELPALHAEALEDHAVWLDAQRPAPAPHRAGIAALGGYASPGPAAVPGQLMAATAKMDEQTTPAPVLEEDATVTAFRQAARALLATHDTTEVMNILAEEIMALEGGDDAGQ